MNPLKELERFGQSIWLDYIRRNLITSGELQRLIDEDGLSGITSNPSIFEKAIAGSHDYDKTIRALVLEGKSVEQIYQNLTIEDVQQAADIFKPVYEQTRGRDGYVSLEVSPHLANDSAGTLSEARRLWKTLNRPNVLIKVPATRQGLPAIQQLISEGININVTLLFSLERYREVAEAYISGLEALSAQGRSLEHVASVASFFISRIDVLADSLLEKKRKSGGSHAKLAQSLQGRIAIDSAKAAYQIYNEIFKGNRFRKLAEKGAASQRLLWASTSTKNPVYSDVKYVEALIGPETVNTLPLETLNTFRDHGRPASRVEEHEQESIRELQSLAELGISLGDLTRQLEEEGVQKFKASFDLLMATLEKTRAAALAEPLDRQELKLGLYESAVQEQISRLDKERFGSRLWRKDGALWKSDAANQTLIRNALGWLHVAEKMEEQTDTLAGFLSEVRAAGFRQVVHMGMGGSSLAPLVFQHLFTPTKEALPLKVLDTTDPATILRLEKEIPLSATLFIVASKSGTTAEPLAFGDYFYEKLKRLKGNQAGENFVAITDPGTPLVKQAQERGFRRIFLNFADIGGRYSALTYFGLVPAALLGVDVAELLARALRMAHACGPDVPANENPGVVLGAVMGELAKQKRNKVTFIAPAPLVTLGMWLEQLLAESTGKESTGILPVAGESLGEPPRYGEDRLFVHLGLKNMVDETLEGNIRALREAGHPLVSIQLDDLLDLGQEFFRWEVATAAAGAVLGINAFDQPNVQESKDNTNRLLARVRDQGSLPETAPALREGSLSLFSPRPDAKMVKTLTQFLTQAQPGDYLALMAYLPENPDNNQALNAIRALLGNGLCLATTLGYGPRFLHSTGQFHKGGPNSGLFIQLTAGDGEDTPIPGAPYTFGVFKQAQAMGDLEALEKHGRRVIRLHIHGEVSQGLAEIAQKIEAALAEILC